MTPQEPDQYQQRYLAHQRRKGDVLLRLMAERHSERMFDDRPVDEQTLKLLADAAYETPSSCARRGVLDPSVVTDRDTKALLGGLLVGGVGWIHRAPAVLMLFAEDDAYVAGDEVRFMPYLDAGVIVGHLGLMAVSLGLAGCFVNPAIREAHKPLFEARFGNLLFCGAYAVGHPRAQVAG